MTWYSLELFKNPLTLKLKNNFLNSSAAEDVRTSQIFLFLYKAGRLVSTSPHFDLKRSFVRTTQNC
jgi:hypothetical protein